MNWVKVLTHIRDHERFLLAGPVARDLWLWGMLYAGGFETDGEIPMVAVMSAAWGEGGQANVVVAAKLVEVGLWERTDAGYRVLRWAEQGNATRAELEAEREAAKARRQRSTPPPPADEAPPPSRRRPNVARTSLDVRRTSPTEVEEEREREHSPLLATLAGPPAGGALAEPERGETSGPDAGARPAGKLRARGTRLPDGWQPSAETQAWARARGLDPLGPLEEFADFWRGVPGARGTKLDWDATYRNRLRQLAERAPPSRPRPRRDSEVTRQPFEPDAPWMKLPEVSNV